MDGVGQVRLKRGVRDSKAGRARRRNVNNSICKCCLEFIDEEKWYQILRERGPMMSIVVVLGVGRQRGGRS